VPVRYLVQCAGYMAITNTESWYLCVLIGGNDLRTYVIPRDREIEAAVLAGVTEFWSHVETRDPPMPETPEEVRMRWPKDTGGTITATADIHALCVQLGTAKAELKSAKAREEQLTAAIEKFMGPAANLHAPGAGQLLATWRTAKPSMKFDAEKFETDYAALFKQYQREVPGSRRFLLKK
jgi:predicted phage-related endonuclease